MANETSNKPMEQIQNLKPYLSNRTQEELDKILAYWEKIKARWEEMKKKFWSKSTATDFRKLLIYKKNHKEEINWKYEYLDKLDWLERERFIEEYLHDDMLYSEKDMEKDYSFDHYDYVDWEKWNIVLKELDELHLWSQHIWDEWAKAIAKEIKLEDWVELHLVFCNIWVEWIEAISKMKLKDWVILELATNEFWAEWVKIIAENMKLKDWVRLNLGNNRIWDEWADAIMKNMELKEWMKLNLQYNDISEKMKDRLKKRNEEQIKKWINCKVEV